MFLRETTQEINGWDEEMPPEYINTQAVERVDKFLGILEGGQNSKMLFILAIIECYKIRNTLCGRGFLWKPIRSDECGLAVRYNTYAAD